MVPKEWLLFHEEYAHLYFQKTNCFLKTTPYLRLEIQNHMAFCCLELRTPKTGVVSCVTGARSQICLAVAQNFTQTVGYQHQIVFRSPPAEERAEFRQTLTG
jgi:hypothetical protein